MILLGGLGVTLALIILFYNQGIKSANLYFRSIDFSYTGINAFITTLT
jgi:hypothetical protein